MKKEIAKGGTVFFDLEADSLFSDYPTWEEALLKMRMTIGVSFDGERYRVYYGEKQRAGEREDEGDIEELGRLFDQAERIVIYHHPGKPID